MEYCRSNTGMDSLPVEVLSEIFKLLGWKGLIVVNRTCVSWNRVLQSLWYHLATRIISKSGGIMKPEEPLSNYTVLELQLWVIRRLRIQEFWSASDTPLYTRVRYLNTEIDERFGQGILPGGRWLLASHGDGGQVYSYDTESYHPAFKKRTIIDMIEEGIWEEWDNMTIWLDSTKATLSFRLMLWKSPYCVYYNGYTTARRSIYQVDLVGHGRDSFLEAQSITIIEHLRRRGRLLVALNDKYLVETWEDPQAPYTTGLYLTRYLKTGIDSQIKLKPICLEFAELGSVVNNGMKGFHNLHITLEGQIIVGRSEHLEIYTIQQATTLGPGRKLSPLHRFHSHSTKFNDPLIHRFKDLSWTVTHNPEGEVYLTRIPLNGTELKTIKLCNYPPKPDSDHMAKLFGCNATIFVKPNLSLNIVQHSWNEEDMESSGFWERWIQSINIPLITDFEWHQDGVSMLCCKHFDDSMGRIVLYYFKQQRTSEGVTGRYIIIDLLAK